MFGCNNGGLQLPCVRPSPPPARWWDLTPFNFTAPALELAALHYREGGLKDLAVLFPGWLIIGDWNANPIASFPSDRTDENLAVLSRLSGEDYLVWERYNSLDMDYELLVFNEADGVILPERTNTPSAQLMATPYDYLLDDAIVQVSPGRTGGLLPHSTFLGHGADLRSANVQ